MAADTPDRLVAFLFQPLVAEILRVKVVHLERTVVHVICLVRAQKEAVMINKLHSSIDVSEQRHVLPRGTAVGLYPEKVRRDDIEVVGVELDLCCEVLHAQTVMTEL